MVERNTYLDTIYKERCKISMDCLVALIEEMRMKLNRYENHVNLTESEIVDMSQKLDRLLNEYYSLNSVANCSFALP
jgi:chromosome condensin MukBEF ATPase and DNA-binding subunit MukB